MKIGEGDAGNKETYKPIILNDSNFSGIIKGHTNLIVDFWAAWCGPCRIMAPIIEELAGEYSGEITFGKLNVDENPNVSSQFGIMSIPTLVLIKEGREIGRIIGALPKDEIKRRIEKAFT